MTGGLVLKKDFSWNRRCGGAQDYRWLGSYTITNSLGNGLYSLECTQNGVVLNRVNGSLRSHFMKAMMQNLRVTLMSRRTVDGEECEENGIDGAEQDGLDELVNGH